MAFFNSRRKLKNVTLTRQYQLRYSGLWFIISILLLFLLAVSTYWLFQEEWMGMLEQNPERSLDFIFARSNFVGYLVLFALFLGICITTLGIFTAHRLAGPLLSLEKAFDEVKKGNLGYRIRFRKEDELRHLENAFNEMMDSMQGKKADKN
jgi:HAMP domain-containing protein